MTPEQLVSSVDGLYSLPEICLKINELVADERSSADDLASLISEDADLTGRLLRTVNSVFYGFRTPVDTIARAITLVGTKDLHNLAIMTSACDLFDGIPADLMNMDDFWHKSVACGVLAQGLGRKSCILHPDRLMVIGVLHEIGRLVIVQQLPEQARDILLITQGQSDLLIEAENQVLGFSHVEVGSALAKSWGLPKSIYNAIRYHRSPFEETEFLIESCIIYVAQVLAEGLHKGGRDMDEVLAGINPEALDLLKLTHEDCILVLNYVTDEVREMYNALIGYNTSAGQAE